MTAHIRSINSRSTPSGETLPPTPHMVRADDSRADAAPGLGRRVQILLGLLVAAAVGLRVFAMLAYQPAVLNLRDSAAYIRFAHFGLSQDTLDPSGYPLFLRLAHTLSSELAFT